MKPIARNGIVAFLLLCAAVFAEEPVLRVGIMTDTHIRETEESLALVRKAFEYFKAQKVDLITHQGDIAEKHCPEGYRLYRKLFQEIFPENPPAEIFVYALHDAIRSASDWAYPQVKKEIGAANDPNGKLVLRGYPFLYFQQPIDYKKCEQLIRETCQEFPDKPVFVLTHDPAYNTADNTRGGGSLFLRNLLDRYPRVVHFSGHSHNTLRNEAIIWQGAFTAVNAGCLQRWEGECAGSFPLRKETDGVLLMEVYRDRLVFRRFEVLLNAEYAADRRWTVPLPFDPATAPYNHDRLRETSAAPEFPAGAALRLSSNDHYLYLSSVEAPNAMQYLVELQKPDADGNWKTFARHDEYGNFYRHTPKRRWQTKMTKGLIAGIDRCRAQVTPVNFFGKPGKPLTMEFPAVAQPETELIWQSGNAPQDCNVIYAKKPLMAENGVYTMVNPSGGWGCPLVYFPEEAWNAPAGSLLRFTVEWEADLPEKDSMILRIRHASAGRTRGYTYTPTGKSGMLRYVFEWKKEENAPYLLMLHVKGKGKGRFGTLKVERVITK